MRRRLVPILFLSAALLASPVGALPDGESFGAALTLEEPTPLAAVVREPERFAGRPVLLRGRLVDVCQKKGCWTVLREGEHHVRVRFQDYGFFLPRDSVGAEAWAEGTVKVVTLSEKDARHFAAESRGGDPSAIHGPQRELSFTARGVRLVR